MEKLYLQTIDSTQIFLIQLLKQKKIKLPYCVYTYEQTNGIGSRNNKWIGKKGNLYLSFVLDIDSMPKDLKLQSYSIYFGYILKITLSQFGSKAILKWPNDIYLSDKKLGGVITTLKSSNVICGIGLNMIHTHNNFASIDVVFDKEKFIDRFLTNLMQKPSWRQIFDDYKMEFYNNKDYYFHYHDRMISLKDTVLNNDGSLSIDNQQIYSFR